MVDFLKQFSLIGTQVTRLHAELHANVDPTVPTHAHIEIQLKPGQLKTPPGVPNTYSVTATFSCHGATKNTTESERLYTIEYVMIAHYRQVYGDAVGYEEFVKKHSSLSRQLYPILRHQLIPVMGQLGLYQVVLPYDLHQPSNEQPSSEHVQAAKLH